MQLGLMSESVLPIFSKSFSFQPYIQFFDPLLVLCVCVCVWCQKICYFHFFKKYGPFLVFFEFVTILPLLYVLVFGPQGMWDLSSPTRDRTCTVWIGRQSRNHWTARDIPMLILLHVAVQFSQHHSLKRVFFLQCIFLLPFLQIN